MLPRTWETPPLFWQEAPKDLQCRLAFIDGDHCYEVVCKDIDNMERLLVPGGWICFDDAFTEYEGVNQAITDRVLKNSKFELCQQLTRKLFVARRQLKVVSSQTKLLTSYNIKQ